MELIFLLFLVLFSAFFSSAETALASASIIRLQALADEGNARARTVLNIKNNPSKMLSAILIGNNLVNNLAAAMATAIAIRSFGEGSVGAASALLTFVVLIVGEVTPKTYATVKAEKLSLLYGSVILLLMKLLTPVIWVVNRLSRILLHFLKIDVDNSMQPMTEQELRTVVDVSLRDGVIENEEKEMICNVVDFGDSRAKDIMVPRADMVTIQEDSSYEEIRDIFQREKYSRLPVYKKDSEDVIGILNLKSFCFCDPASFSLKELIYQPYFTFESKKTSDLLIEMRHNSAGLCIILDEYGVVSGLLSLEDLLEEIVGEIRDEYDEDEMNLIQKKGDNLYLIDGAVKLDDLNDRLKINLFSEEYDSLGGYIMEKLDRIARQGDVVRTPEGHILMVTLMDKNRVAQVQLKKYQQNTATC